MRSPLLPLAENGITPVAKSDAKISSDAMPSPGTMFNMMKEMQATLDLVQKQSHEQQAQLARAQMQNDVKSAFLGMPNSGKPDQMATLIQTAARRHAVRRKMHVQCCAVYQVQRTLRGAAVRRTFAKQRASVLAIQVAARRHIAKSAVHFMKRIRAATRIEAGFRGFRARALHRTKGSLMREVLRLRSLLRANSDSTIPSTSAPHTRQQYAGNCVAHNIRLDGPLLQSWWNACDTAVAAPLEFTPYIYLVLKQVHPDQEISDAALRVMNDLCIVLLMELADASSKLLDKQRQLGVRSFETAVRLVFPGELARHAVSEGCKAAKKFEERTTIWNGRHMDYSVAGRSARAGLTFPVATISVMLARYMHCSVGDVDVAYLTAVLEYVVAEVLELSGNASADNCRTRHTPRDLVLAIRHDEELTTLFSDVVIIGGGRLCNIHDALLHDLSETAFCAIEKNDLFVGGGSLSREAALSMKESIEKFAAELETGTQRPSVNDECESTDDERLVRQVFPQTVLLRFCARAGVLCVSSLCLDELRSVAQGFLKTLVRNAISCNAHIRSSTVLGADVLKALQFQGRRLIGSGLQSELMQRASYAEPNNGPLASEIEHERLSAAGKTCDRASDDEAAAKADAAAESRKEEKPLEAGDELGVAHSEAIAAIYAEQDMGGKAPLVPFLAFEQLIKSIAFEFNWILGLDPCAIVLAYAALEGYLLDLLEDANLNALHTSCRVVIQPKDVQLAQRVHGRGARTLRVIRS